jgi:hypothetical protein
MKMGTSHLRRHKHSTPDLQFYQSFHRCFQIKNNVHQVRHCHTKCSRKQYHWHRTNLQGSQCTPRMERKMARLRVWKRRACSGYDLEQEKKFEVELYFLRRKCNKLHWPFYQSFETMHHTTRILTLLNTTHNHRSDQYYHTSPRDHQCMGEGL